MTWSPSLSLAHLLPNLFGALCEHPRTPGPGKGVTGEGEPPRILAPGPRFLPICPHLIQNATIFPKTADKATRSYTTWGRNTPRFILRTNHTLSTRGWGGCEGPQLTGDTPHPGDISTYPPGGQTPRSAARGSPGHLQACVSRAWGGRPHSPPGAQRMNPSWWGAGTDCLSSLLSPASLFSWIFSYKALRRMKAGRCGWRSRAGPVALSLVLLMLNFSLFLPRNSLILSVHAQT